MKLAFDVDKFVATVRSVAPDLWELVCEITQSVNERKGRSASVNKESFAGRIKHLHVVSSTCTEHTLYLS